MQKITGNWNPAISIGDWIKFNKDENELIGIIKFIGMGVIEVLVEYENGVDLLTDTDYGPFHVELTNEKYEILSEYDISKLIGGN